MGASDERSMPLKFQPDLGSAFLDSESWEVLPPHRG
jgi:hypothetical protein